MRKLRAFVTVVQPQFFHLSALSILLGTALAYWQYQILNVGVLLLSLFSMACIHAGVNSSNEYFDFVSGADLAVTEETMFGGGTKVLPRGLLNPRLVLAAALTFFTIGAALGLYLVSRTGPGVLGVGLAGVLLGYFYTAPPLKLAYRGLGELFVGLAFGPLITLGAYYSQTIHFEAMVFLLSFTPGLLNAAAIVCHRYPDLEPDRKTGKRTIVVILGKRRSSRLFSFLLWAAYVPPVLAAVTGGVPATCLIALITLPTALRLGLRFNKGYDDMRVVENVGLGTMRLLTVVPGLLIAALLLDRLFTH